MSVLVELLSLIWCLVVNLTKSGWRLIFPTPMRSLKNEVALITGAGQGIGRQLALQLADLGVKIICWDLNHQTCEQTADLARSRGVEAWSFQCDVSNQAQVAKVTEQTRTQVNQPVTILINNAGIMPAKPFLNFQPDEVEHIFKVNVFSQFWILHQFLPEFKQRNRGHIVTLCSVAGVTGTRFLVPYCSSKFAIRGLIDALDIELEQEGGYSNIKFTTVFPFTVNTGLAHEPTTRFPWLIPIVEPKACASTIIEAIRREEEEVFVPRRLKLSMKLGKLLPRKIVHQMNNFLNCKVGYKK